MKNKNVLFADFETGGLTGPTEVTYRPSTTGFYRVTLPGYPKPVTLKLVDSKHYTVKELIALVDQERAYENKS